MTNSQELFQHWLHYLKQ